MSLCNSVASATNLPKWKNIDALKANFERLSKRENLFCVVSAAVARRTGRRAAMALSEDQKARMAKNKASAMNKKAAKGLFNRAMRGTACRVQSLVCACGCVRAVVRVRLCAKPHGCWPRCTVDVLNGYRCCEWLGAVPPKPPACHECPCCCVSLTQRKTETEQLLSISFPHPSWGGVGKTAQLASSLSAPVQHPHISRCVACH